MKAPDDWFAPIASQFPGSCPASAATAAFAALEAGATNLELRVLAHAAGYGGTSWRTHKAVARDLRRPDGRQYHFDSVGRATRNCVRRGWMQSERLGPGAELPQGARYRTTTSGTTVKRVCWAVLGVRNPTPRGQRRRAAREQTPREPAPRLSAVIKPPPRPPRPKPHLEALQERGREARRALEAWANEHEGAGTEPVSVLAFSTGLPE